MSRQINQPINQVKLTNVAIVKHAHKGKRFEIACYRNKIMDYRSGFERDLSEVLQSERIFTNVSKGQFAKASELEQVFGTRDEAAIAKMILEKGEFQLSDLERQQLLDNTLSQIATQIAANCVHPETKRQYTVGQIRSALSNYHLQPHKPIKKQYLDAIKFLKQTSLPIERAKMELALRYPVSQDETVQAALNNLSVDIVQSKSGPGLVVAHVDPSLYRDLNDLAASVKGGRLEILQQVIMADAGEGGGTQSSSSNALSSAPLELKQQTSRDDPGSDEEQQELLLKLQAVGIMRSEEDDNVNAMSLVQPNRKQLRQQQKKDKKAQRRSQEVQEEGERDEVGSRSPEGDENESFSATTSQSHASNSASTDSKSCNTCGGSFSSMSLYREHFRSDWHRFNLKLKLKGIPAVSEEEFRLCDAETFFGGKDED